MWTEFEINNLKKQSKKKNPKGPKRNMKMKDRLYNNYLEMKKSIWPIFKRQKNDTFTKKLKFQFQSSRGLQQDELMQNKAWKL